MNPELSPVHPFRPASALPLDRATVGPFSTNRSSGMGDPDVSSITSSRTPPSNPGSVWNRCQKESRGATASGETAYELSWVRRSSLMVEGSAADAEELPECEVPNSCTHDPGALARKLPRPATFGDSKPS